jgi:hypothetical protein
MCIPQYFHTDTGHLEKMGTTWPLQHSRKSVSRGVPNFGDLSVRSRYGPPGCSLPELIQTRKFPARLELLLPGFQPLGHPMTAGHDYDAILGLAPAELAPASTTAILAASPSSVLWAHKRPPNPSSAISGCPRPPTTSSASTALRKLRGFPKFPENPSESVPRARDSGGSWQPRVTVTPILPSVSLKTSASATM